MRKRKKQLLSEIDELQARIVRLEECIKTQDRLIEGYQKREHAVVAALETVENSIGHRINDAEQKAMRITDDAESYAKQLRADAEMKAAEVAEYIDRYNAMLESAAAEAARNAEFFLAFAKDKALPKIDLQIASRGVTPLIETAEELPDAEGDPKRLMQNIYRIEHRELPDENEKTVETVQAEDDRLEPEPDDGPLAPKVSELLGTGNGEKTQDASLEELLDEIIQSGDK